MVNKNLNMGIKRGDIVICDLGVIKEHYSTQFGIRPCVVVSNNAGNKHAPVLIVVPLTTRPKAKLPTHVPINTCKQYTLALCEQIVTVSKNQVIKPVGRISSWEQSQVDRAMRIALHL